MEAANLEMTVIDHMPSVMAPRALTRIENERLEVTIPEAAIALAPDRLLPLKAGVFTADEIMGETPIGEIAFASQSPLANGA